MSNSFFGRIEKRDSDLFTVLVSENKDGTKSVKRVEFIGDSDLIRDPLDIDAEEYGLKDKHYYEVSRPLNSVNFITDKKYVFRDSPLRYVDYEIKEDLGVGAHNKTLSRLKVNK